MSDEPKRFNSVIEMLTHDCHKYALENERLKAEVERLRKAGDTMCKFFDDHGFYGFGFQEAWNAAKEGKQP